MKELYADFNDFAADGNLSLTCQGSLASIRALDEPLQEGETVWLSDGELRVQARAFQFGDGTWTAESDWKFVR